MPFQKAFFICIASLLTGCASISYPLPKCDGATKRPLNRSMWQWQEERAGVSRHHTAEATEASQTAPGVAIAPLNYAETVTARAADHPAFAGFDEAGSRRACRAG
ncbi:type IV secretion system protein VirB7 [Rhizobium sp. PP-F2F-G48]|uniref:type IV secretion system protein VirB7 n=1 Tax=Rhizobium sp. PP-F2F-G48 TaxID=2135651 RepID=UPI0010E14F40|nr:type IV secretion system protein VirB7 [Rhizobium sp. PP-F2F-G48]TCM51153.1 type IV secretion system protein VirB7 [Rhizobium sp. PP-F2F-G48]